MNPNRSPITTHVLDQGQGKPATGLALVLEKQEGTSWKTLAQAQTDQDGRVEDLLPKGSQAAAGRYRLTFQTGAYFQQQGKTTFYPEIAILFSLENPAQHHHVPLLLNAFGYSTYRGT